MHTNAIPYTPVDRDAVARVAFASLRGMKLGLAHRLLEHLPDEKTFFTATASQLSAMLGFSTKLLDSDLRESTLKKAREELHLPQPPA